MRLRNINFGPLLKVGISFGEIGDLSVAPLEKISSCFFPWSVEPCMTYFLCL